MNDIRWFADRRPRCIIENELKRQLNATDNFEYSAKLQSNGLNIYTEMVRKVPKFVIRTTAATM
jgi:hypothetical protein